jgi:hypothetical protein
MRIIMAVLMLALGVAAAPPQSAKARPAAKASLTGCIDEHDGQYVLTNDTNLQPTARLKPAAGSPEDNFARHMGQKVTVKGALSNEEPLPIMTVDSIDIVSQTCAPASEGQQQ